MTKKFCDLCGEPADDRAENIEMIVPHGEPWRRHIPEGVEQCRIVVRANIHFRDHPSGFGGPPDLCWSCAAKLVSELAGRMMATVLPKNCGTQKTP